MIINLNLLAPNENKTQKKSNLKNLDNIDFDNNTKLIRIQSPRSKFALEQLGLEEERLYKISKKEYLENNLELKKEKPEILDKRYDHYEKKRLEAIKEARNIRNQIIENYTTTNNSKNSTKGFNHNNRNDNEELKSKSNIQTQTQDNEIIKRELEKLEYLKKQQILEIKNLIDYEYEINETRKKNDLKDKEKKEKEEKKRQEK